jgi:hypothetical protein
VRPHVGELLLFCRVDVHVAGAAVGAHDHALVHVRAGPDEELRAFLEVEQAVGVREAVPIGHQHARDSVGHIARPRAVALADLVQERRAARLRQQLASEADQAADRDHVLHSDATVGVGAHLLETGFAIREGSLHRPDELGRHVHGDPLVRLLGLAADLVEENLGA